MARFAAKVSPKGFLERGSPAAGHVWFLLGGGDGEEPPFPLELSAIEQQIADIQAELDREIAALKTTRIAIEAGASTISGGGGAKSAGFGAPILPADFGVDKAAAQIRSVGTFGSSSAAALLIAGRAGGGKTPEEDIAAEVKKQNKKTDELIDVNIRILNVLETGGAAFV